jgi:hypothetical protein
VRNYPIRDGLKAWDHLLAYDRSNGGISSVSVSNLLKNADNTLTTAQISKLNSVAVGATANSTDAQLRNRATHTGEQAQSTVTNLVSDLAAKAPKVNPVLLGALVNGVALRTNAGTGTFLRGDGTYAAASGGGGGNVTIGTVEPTPATGDSVLWIDTTGGNVTMNLVTGD